MDFEIEQYQEKSEKSRERSDRRIVNGLTDICDEHVGMDLKRNKCEIYPVFRVF